MTFRLFALISLCLSCVSQTEPSLMAAGACRGSPECARAQPEPTYVAIEATQVNEGRAPDMGSKAVCPMTLALERQRKEVFDKTLNGSFSTAPRFVLVTLVSEDGRSEQDVTVIVNMLRGAIDAQCRAGCDAGEMARAKDSRRFRFFEKGARARVRRSYTEQDLGRARSELALLSPEALNAEAKREDAPRTGERHRPPFESMYSDLRGPELVARIHAIAHVLLECGFQPFVPGKHWGLRIEKQ